MNKFYWMVIGLLLGLVNLRAEIKLPALVSDNMVLQQATKVRLWGNATPNSSLKVRSSWDNTEYTAQVNDQGRWEIWVQTPSASFEKQQLTLKNGQDKIVLHDLLIGEVWFGSGQSNMEMPLRGFWHCPIEGGNHAIATSGKYKNSIRYATIQRVGALEPKDYPVGGEWKVCDPRNAPEFGATAYFFATLLTEVLNVPVGIINCSWGGSTVEGWLPKDILRNYMNIYLIEGSSKLLGAMSPEASSNAKRFLEDMGVNIILQKRVVDYKDGNVFLDDGQTIPTRTLLWVSGVKAVHFDHIEGELLTRGERIIVNECNQVKGLSNIFAIGDVCWMAEPDYPNGHPQVAQVAIQQGELLAENLQRIEALKKPRPFHYKNLGTLATVGRNKAVADLNKVKLHGFTAWLVWMLVHLRSILGIKNKLIVLIDWIWNYFTYDRSMRFILFIQKHKQDGTQGTEPTL